MDLIKFKSEIKIFILKDSNILRERYISNFINTKDEYYLDYIEKKKQYSDGLCYTGYLWDCLKEKIVIGFNELQKFSNQFVNVYILWDIHSEQNIFIEDYWKFGKKNVIMLNYQELLYNLDYFPEDIYIFDDSYKWTLIITHEYVNNERWCMKSGNL